jgi:hypothetical protein
MYCGYDWMGQLGESGSLEERVVTIPKFQGCNPYLYRLTTASF